MAKLVLNWLVYLPGRAPVVRKPDPVLKMVYYAITEGCNLRCPYCYASSEKCAPNELSTEEAFALVDQSVDLGAEVMVFTGGEPMLRRDLFDVVAYARGKGLRANIITNATLIRDEEIAARIARLFDVVTVSIDGGNAESHERTRGPGTFDKTIRALRMLNTFDVHPMINHVVDEDNVDGLADVGELFADISVRAVRIMHHTGLGRGMADGRDFGWEHYQQAHSFIWSNPAARHMLPDGPVTEKPCAIRGNCGMGGHEIYVDSLGEVYPCKLVTGAEHSAGNIRSTPLRELFDSPVLQEMRANFALDGHNLTDCTRCYIKGACGGGCRAHHMARTGDVLKNSRAFCRVLRHQMVTSMWAATGAGKKTVLGDGSDRAFVPRLVRDDSIHPVYLDWQVEAAEQAALPVVIPPPLAPAARRRLLPVVS